MIFETDELMIPLDKVASVFKGMVGQEGSAWLTVYVQGQSSSYELKGADVANFLVMYRMYHERLDNPMRVCLPPGEFQHDRIYPIPNAFVPEELAKLWVGTSKSCFTCEHEFGPDEHRYIVVPHKEHKPLHAPGENNRYCRDYMEQHFGDTPLFEG